MKDTIYRADAIEACCRGWNNTAEDCIRNIKALPSAEAVQGWISCSERLPTQTGEYLVSVKYKVLSFTDKFGYEPTTDGGWHDADAPNQRIIDWNEFVVAWMPLPKPYREDGEE